MKAAVYERIGGPEVLHLVERPDPVVAPSEVLIRVKSISIEGGELLMRRMLDPGPDPAIPGYSAAGEVVAVGSAVSGFAPGDKVATFASGGSYAELRATPAETCWRVPEGADILAASAVPTAFGTAGLALRLASVTPGETVLVQGAAGGVGLAAVQMAARAGARVIGTSTSADSLEMLKDFGLDDGIVVGNGPTDEQVRALLGGRGADVLIDNVGGDGLQTGLQSLEDGGRAVIVALAGQGSPLIDSRYILPHRLSVFGCFLTPVLGEPVVQQIIGQALKDFAEGKLRLPIDKVFPLSEAAAAHSHAEQRGRFGRVFMVP